MKTTKISIFAIAATCALGASALADEQSQTLNNQQRQVRRAAYSSRTMDKPNTEANKSVVVRTVEYPFAFLGRAGRSIWHTPQIVSETFKGERSVISKQGIMARNEEMTPGEKVASAPSQSIANRRG